MMAEKYHRLALNTIFFTASFLYIWLLIDPRLLHHGGGIIRGFPVFFSGWDLFTRQLAVPGGLTLYLSAFFSQFAIISWAGALVITITIALITILFDALMKRMNGGWIRWLRFAPAFMLLALYSGYGYHFTSSLALLAAFVFAWIFLLLPIQSDLKTAIAFTILSVFTYCFAGAAFFIFSLPCLLYAGIINKRYLFALYGVILTIILPYALAAALFDINPADAYTIRSPLYWQEKLFQNTGVLPALLLYCIPAACFLYLALRPALTLSGTGERFYLLTKIKLPKWMAMPTGLTCLLGIGYAIYLSFFDAVTRRNITIDYYAYHREWQQVLEHASGTIDNSYLTAAIDRALYHKRKLGDYMPLWQQPGDLLLMKSDHANAYWYKFDLYLDLGFINMAQHNLNEALEFYGEQPLLLKRLALVHLIKGNMGTARIYLNSLTKTLFYRRWADAYLQAMKEDPGLHSHEEISYYRGIMLEKDYPFPYSTDQIFKDLLEKNDHNRMAFEYLMAVSLLSKDFEAIMNNLAYFTNFNYSATPKLYQEAIVLITSNPDNTYPIPDAAINVETIELFKLFFRTINQNRENRQKAIDMLKDKHSNSYYFYCLTH